MRTTSYSRGDVVFVDIPFSGSIGSKRRPAIVLSSDDFHLAGSKLIVAGVTSNIKSPFRPGDVFLNDWSQAGLIKSSAVRGLIITIDRSEIVRKLGVISSHDMTEVEVGIASVIGLKLA